MRIVFICGCLEPGKDGVGDYTRRLAAGLIDDNIEVAILALNDQFITEVICQDQTSDKIKICTYRIPSRYNTNQRYAYAKKWINSITPDWLSLQYVPFSFNKKGLSINLGRNLSKLTVNTRWHIMFHELWVGMKKGSTLKHIVWGELQKHLIIKLINKLKPTLIHTQTKLYQIQLSKLGFQVEYLPLFSNVPVNHSLNKLPTFEEKIKLVNFGTIHPTITIKDFAEEAAIYEKKTGVKIELTLIGRCGVEQEKWIKIWKSVGLNIFILGEQSLEKISEIFNASTFGISTTAPPLVEKSGSVAAMLEHDLPVICISNVWHPRGISGVPKMPGIIEYKFGNFDTG
ncbi:glycosyltransferase family 1 protein [bacterium]|nr:MAG: glycosyltransferase family 1 protein [bacterium]